MKGSPTSSERKDWVHARQGDVTEDVRICNDESMSGPRKVLQEEVGQGHRRPCTTRKSSCV